MYPQFKEVKDQLSFIDEMRVNDGRIKLAAGLIQYTDPLIAAVSSRLSHNSVSKSEPEADKKLLKKLIKAGDEHAKGMRGVMYCIVISAPRYFWAEMDTYTVGRIPLGSTSSMHTESKGLKDSELLDVKENIKESLLQTRIAWFSAPTLRRIFMQRYKHRLPHWRYLCVWIEQLPNMDLYED